MLHLGRVGRNAARALQAGDGGDERLEPILVQEAGDIEMLEETLVVLLGTHLRVRARVSVRGCAWVGQSDQTLVQSCERSRQKLCERWYTER